MKTSQHFRGGDLFFQQNNSITDLNLPGLTSVSGDVKIGRNDKLTKLPDNLATIDGYLYINDNPFLSTCAAAGICAYLTNNAPDRVLIYGNLSGCNSEAEIESACTALPVTLIDFVAAKKENVVYMRWSTSSEMNSSRFEIQHSDNKGQSWKILGEVQASKESFEAKHYDFTHFSPSKGENLYRLKMVDLDGTFAFSRIRNVNMDQVNMLSVYPNPVADQLTVETANTTPVAKILIYDTAGKLLVSKDVKLSGYSYQVETASLAAGTYTIQVINGQGKKEVYKFIKLPH